MPKKSRAFRFAGLPLCLFALALSAVAGPEAASTGPFIVNSWSAENGPDKGPPDNEIISVIQAHDGYLWLGTLHGLVRFDGIHFTLFDEMNTPGLSSDRIVFLFEDRRTNLWVGTESAGLSVMKNGVITNFAGETAGTGRKVMNAEEDPAGDIWFYTSEGLLQYHHGGMSFHPGVWRAFMGPLQNWEVERKNFGPFPWGNSPVTAAVRRPERQFDSSARSAWGFSGVARTEPFSASGRNRVCLPITFCPCAWIARAICGWERTAAV